MGNDNRVKTQPLESDKHKKKFSLNEQNLQGDTFANLKKYIISYI